MQFIGQTHLLRVASPQRETLHARFAAAYFARFRVKLGEGRAAVVNANCSVIGEREGLDLSTLIAPVGRKATLAEAMTCRRDVSFDGAWHDTPVYWRDHLPKPFTLIGPAIVEQMDTTVLIEPGDKVVPDAYGNLIVTIGGAHGA